MKDGDGDGDKFDTYRAASGERAKAEQLSHCSTDFISFPTDQRLLMAFIVTR